MKNLRSENCETDICQRVIPESVGQLYGKSAEFNNNGKRAGVNVTASITVSNSVGNNALQHLGRIRDIDSL